MRLFKSLFAISLVVLFGLHCSERTPAPIVSDPEPNPPVVRTPAELTEQEIAVLNSTNKFGLSLFREIASRTTATKNIFISPLSVSYALGLCYNGANGETREAIASTLQSADLSLEEMNQAYHDLTRILVQADSLVDFQVANSFWSKEGISIQPQFINLAQSYFDARIEELDFQAPWAPDTINAWIDRATNGKIEDMVKPPIDPAVVAMLFNAIYFKGDWMFPFDTANTVDDTFHLSDGTETACRMMRISQADCLMEVSGENPQTDTNITYYSDNQVWAIGMPYGAGDFRMTIILPNLRQNPTGTVDDIIAAMTTETWSAWTDGNPPDKFDLDLPRFRFEYEVSLVDVLKALGMEIAFTPGAADFSNLFTDAEAWIDEVKQKSFVQVDEKGTEAAAVTQVIWTTSMPPYLRCNRPFLIVIHEDVSGAILFMGRIANPVWEE